MSEETFPNDDGRRWGYIDSTGLWIELPKKPMLLAEMGPPPFYVTLPLRAKLATSSTTQTTKKFLPMSIEVFDSVQLARDILRMRHYRQISYLSNNDPEFWYRQDDVSIAEILGKKILTYKPRDGGYEIGLNFIPKLRATFGSRIYEKPLTVKPHEITPPPRGKKRRYGKARKGKTK